MSDYTNLIANKLLNFRLKQLEAVKTWISAHYIYFGTWIITHYFTGKDSTYLIVYYGMVFYFLIDITVVFTITIQFYI